MKAIYIKWNRKLLVRLESRDLLPQANTCHVTGGLHVIGCARLRHVTALSDSTIHVQMQFIKTTTSALKLLVVIRGHHVTIA